MLVTLVHKLNLGFSKCRSFLRPKRKLGLVSFVILSALIITVWFAGTGTARAFWDTVVLGISGILLAVAGWFIQLSIFILKFVIEVSGYNGFIDSTAVIVGWIMVRDVVNMFFVVILLIIAFGTILGLEKYEWKKLLVKLLMAAVIVNFSRIICGVIIDIAQVVMITFINGIAATAGGNLVNMFQVDKILSLSRGSTGAGAINGNTSQIFLASVAAITFAGMMMMTMLTFLFLLMARMVMLWILIVLSPFAFVLNVVPQTEKYASEWWGEFAGNVVAGPIIAFFLWLSFVTVGAGNVMDEISSNNAIPAGTGISSPNAETEQSRTTGISDVMTWANMANFAIAIGMLLAGAKMAQKLGAAGGAMMAKSWEFGKKVGMIASGVAAGRWAARGIGAGAKKAGKFALMKAPLIGGEAWQRRGRALKAEVSKAWTKGWVEPRLLKAKKHIETAYGETGKGKPFSRIYARMALWTAPAAFKEEYVKDRESGAKFAQEQLEHIVSTSKTPMGKFKTEAEAKLLELKETGQEIKARKMQDIAEKSRISRDAIAEAVAGGASVEELEKSSQFTSREIFDYERWESANKSAIKAGQIKESIDAIRARERAEAKEKMLAEVSVEGRAARSREGRAAIEKAAAKQIDDQLTSIKELRELEEIKKLLMGQGKNKQAVINFSKAEIENLKEDYEIVRDESLAEARANAFRNIGDDLRANQVLSEHQAKVAKREFDRANSMSWEEKTFALQTMPVKIQQVEKDLAAAASPEERKRFEEIKNRTIRRTMALQTALKSEGKESAQLADTEALKAVGWTDSLDDGNRIRAELSKILGKVVERGQEQKAMADIYEAYGGLKKAQGAMTMYSNSNKIAALKGAGTLMGVVGSSRDATGQLEMSFNPTVNVGAGYYPTKEAEADHRKWTSANGYAKVNIEGGIVGFDEERAKQLAAIFEGKNALFITQMQNGFFTSLNNALVNDRNKEEFNKFLQTISQTLKDTGARKKFEERAAELLKKIGADKLP